MEQELCDHFDLSACLAIGKLPKIKSRRDTPALSPYFSKRMRKMSFDALWEKTHMAESDADRDYNYWTSGGGSSLRSDASSVAADIPTDPGAKPLSPNSAARFAALKPSENWTRMRSRSRSGSNASVSAWKPRSLSTASLPSLDDLRRTGWRPSMSPRLEHRRSSAAFAPRRPSSVARRPSGSAVDLSKHAADAARDIAAFKAATNQFPGDPTVRRDSTSPHFQRAVVEVTGDPSGVANGTYYFAEKPNRLPFFVRNSPHKATLAPRQSHGMWFMLCWGVDKDGKKIYTDYCSPHDGELPPTKGWRKCSRTKDKLHWVFGDEVPIKVDVLKEAYPAGSQTYS